MNSTGKITDIPGIRVGHWTDRKSLTGCTVIIFPEGTTGSVEIAGAAPASRETEILKPTSWVQEVHALVFSGGSAYGLDAAGGVMNYLEKIKVGHKTSCGIVPIVPAVAIFDLIVGNGKRRPTFAEGLKAAQNASVEFKTGRIGAGIGATCGKWRGIKHSYWGGIFSSSIKSGKIITGALVVVNPIGDIINEKGKPVKGKKVDKRELSPVAGDRPTSTVLAVVATNARFTKTECKICAQRIHYGIARAIYPSHTKHDGDAGFFFSCGNIEADLDLIIKMTSDVVEKAIRQVSQIT